MRFKRLLIAVAVILSCFTVTSQIRPVHASECIVISGTNPPTTTPIPGYYYASHTYTAILTGAYNLTTNLGSPPSDGIYYFTVPANSTLTIIDNNIKCNLFNDGRLNDNDAGETFAVYCQADGSVKVLAIYKGVGYPAFTATKAEIGAVPAKPAKNTLIKEGNGAFLYRLTSGQLQVNRREDGTPAKDYSFRFNCLSF